MDHSFKYLCNWLGLFVFCLLYVIAKTNGHKPQGQAAMDVRTPAFRVG